MNGQQVGGLISTVNTDPVPNGVWIDTANAWSTSTTLQFQFLLLVVVDTYPRIRFSKSSNCEMFSFEF